MQTTERTGEADQGALPSVVLEITRGRAKHLRREVRKTAFLIGTAPDCDLVLGDPRFPEVHSYVYVGRDRVTIRRLGLGPELLVGGRTIVSADLDDLDLLQMGSYEFRMLIEWPQAAVRAEQPQAGSAETFAGHIRQESAIERLMRDVEQFSAGPRLTLFVGDGDADDHKPGRDLADRAVWRQGPRKAIS